MSRRSVNLLRRKGIPIKFDVPQSSTAAWTIAGNHELVSGVAASGSGNTGTSRFSSVINSTSDAAGLHVYQEEVFIGGDQNATDHGVLCELSKTLPANAKIVDCGMVVTELSQLASTIAELAISATAGTAQGVVVDSQTVIIGAGGSAEGSGALVCSTGATLGDAEINNASVGAYLDVGSKTSVYVAADGTSNTVGEGSLGKVLVTIRYYGSAAPA